LEVVGGLKVMGGEMVACQAGLGAARGRGSGMRRVAGALSARPGMPWRSGMRRAVRAGLRIRES